MGRAADVEAPSPGEMLWLIGAKPVEEASPAIARGSVDDQDCGTPRLPIFVGLGKGGNAHGGYHRPLLSRGRPSPATGAALQAEHSSLESPTWDLGSSTLEKVWNACKSTSRRKRWVSSPPPGPNQMEPAPARGPKVSSSPSPTRRRPKGPGLDVDGFNPLGQAGLKETWAVLAEEKRLRLQERHRLLRRMKPMPFEQWCREHEEKKLKTAVVQAPQAHPHAGLLQAHFGKSRPHGAHGKALRLGAGGHAAHSGWEAKTWHS